MAGSLNGKTCQSCDRPLEGRQLKFCRDAECVKYRQWVDRLWKVYHLTPEQYQAIWDFQGGRCPITGRELGDKSAPHIDHDHVEGHVRGIVTAYANTRLIGRLRDWRTAQNLADYLKTPPAERALGERVIAPGRPAKRRKKTTKKRGTK